MSSRLTDKEAKLLTVSIANVNGGPTAIVKLVILLTVAFRSILKTLPQIDFDKVHGPAGYQDARNAKIMFVRLLAKITDDGLEGTPGRSKPVPKAKKASAGGGEDAQSSPSATATLVKPTKKRKVASELVEEDTQSSPSVAATPVKPTKKRKVASELLEEDTPTKQVRFALKEAAGEEEVFPGDDETTGKFLLLSGFICMRR